MKLGSKKTFSVKSWCLASMASIWITLVPVAQGEVIDIASIEGECEGQFITIEYFLLLWAVEERILSNQEKTYIFRRTMEHLSDLGCSSDGATATGLSGLANW